MGAEKSVKFGREGRFSVSAGLLLGPGQYDRKDSAIVLTTGKTFGIGRHYYDKVIRPGWEREGLGQQGCGPGPPLWRDIHKDGSRAHTIKNEKRFKEDREAAKVPGPGAYDREERGISKL